MGSGRGKEEWMDDAVTTTPHSTYLTSTYIFFSILLSPNIVCNYPNYIYFIAFAGQEGIY